MKNISAMEFKRYRNRGHREARDRSPLGMQNASLRDVVGGIVRIVQQHGMTDGEGNDSPILRSVQVRARR